MVSVNINFQKKDIFLFSAIVIFLIAVGYVVAFGDYAGNEAQINGHSSDEMMVKNSSGSFITLQQLIDQGGLGGGSLSSQCNLIASTTAVEKVVKSVPVPAQCIDRLCFLYLEQIDGSGAVFDMVMEPYLQKSDSGLFIVRFAHVADHTNGDSIFTSLIDIGDSQDLYDDCDLQGVAEKSKDNFCLYDWQTAGGLKLYLCHTA